MPNAPYPMFFYQQAIPRKKHQKPPNLPAEPQHRQSWNYLCFRANSIKILMDFFQLFSVLHSAYSFVPCSTTLWILNNTMSWMFSWQHLCLISNIDMLVSDRRRSKWITLNPDRTDYTELPNNNYKGVLNPITHLRHINSQVIGKS